MRRLVSEGVALRNTKCETGVRIWILNTCSAVLRSLSLQGVTPASAVLQQYLPKLLQGVCHEKCHHLFACVRDAAIVNMLNYHMGCTMIPCQKPSLVNHAVDS